MKKIFFFLIMCAFASSMFAQWHRMPPPPRRPVYHHNGYGVMHRQRVIVNHPPQVVVRQYGSVNLRIGPVYYGGGWGSNVIFLRQPRVIVQQPRVVYTTTPRTEGQAVVLKYLIERGDIVILVDQQQQMADSSAVK